MNYRLSISGMSCAGCVASVERLLKGVAGVTRVEVNFAQSVALVEGEVALQPLLDAVKGGGYHAAEMRAIEEEQQERDARDAVRYRRQMGQALLALLYGGGLMGLMAFDRLPMLPEGQIFWIGIGLVTLLLMVVSGGHFYRTAWSQLRHRSANMDSLIALGTGSAWLYSMGMALWPEAVPALSRHTYFEAAVMILAFINLGNALELRARGRTSAAIRQLIGLQPKTARVVRNGVEADLPIVEVGLNETLRIRPGERIAVDGVVLEGSSFVDEAMLTGEPLPKRKEKGSLLVAGTVNGSGSLLQRSTRIGQETLLAQIIERVRQAQGSKPPIGRRADQIAAYFVPAVMGLAVVAAAIWWLFGPEPSFGYAVTALMTVLLIACPCALGLATPIAVMVGVGRAAELGILIRDGQALELAEQITTVIFDKTGTLTEGKPQLQALWPLESWSESELLRWIASLERHSEHPLAYPFLTAAAEQSLSLLPVEQFTAVAGLGIAGTVEGQRVVIGSSAWLEQQGVVLDPPLPQPRPLHAGEMAIAVAVAGQPVGLAVVADRVKLGAAAAVKRLQQMGLKVVLLSGDSRAVAEVLAAEVGITEVIAPVLPNEKAAVVSRLQQQGERVAMVGDGLNDAPALAQADVGFAMGSGTDVAMESAAITLIGGDLEGVYRAIALSKATLRTIRHNLWGAFLYNSLGIPVAAGVIYPFTGLLLNPMIAGAAMAASSLTVVLNANRLRFFQPITTQRYPP